MPDPAPKRTASADADRSLQALERLRGRVEAAVKEIERLRAENATLTERVRELAALDAAGADPDALHLSLDTDPDVLRTKVQGFIETLDRMLAEPVADAPDPTS